MAKNICRICNKAFRGSGYSYRLVIEPVCDECYEKLAKLRSDNDATRAKSESFVNAILANPATASDVKTLQPIQ